MKRIEPYKEQPERIPDEKIEIVFHQGERLGPCFGEHTFNFRTESVRGTHRPDASKYWCHSSGEPPSHFHCRSSRDFFRQTISKAEEEIGRKMTEELDKKIMDMFFK